MVLSCGRITISFALCRLLVMSKWKSMREHLSSTSYNGIATTNLKRYDIAVCLLHFQCKLKICALVFLKHDIYSMIRVS